MMSSSAGLTKLLPQSILILDDDTFLLDLMGDMLRDQGMIDIRAMSNAQQAMATLQERHPDILLCDLNMPETDGIEFIRQLAQQSYTGNIVIMSSVDMTVLRAAESLAIAHGLNLISVLSKPFDTRSLAHALSHNTLQAADSEPANGTTTISAEELRNGLSNDCITLLYQPKVSTQTMRVPDIECLARWQHAQRGLLPPAAFIEVAEKNGLIDELTLVVLRQAAAQLRNWQQAGLQVRLAINVSMNSLRKLDLPEIFENIVHAEGVHPGSFVLEITESRLISDLTLTLDVLTRLRLKGFDLAIDDFGTGYSTLENLRQLPFSELKLDRSFVSGITNDKTKRAILESSVRLGKALKLNLVAEGVETREEWDLICALGCHEVQGYFITQPMHADAVSQWITDWENGKLSQANFAGTPTATDTAAAKILVVDNNRNLRDEFVNMLGQHYQTLTAESGEDALMIASLEMPDLILLDTDLPGMDGFATCQQLKADEKTSHIPVMFLSAYNMLDDKLRGYEAGGADYLSKPGDPLEVRAKIEHLLTLSARHRQLKEMASYASSTAMTAITNIGELGTLLSAFRTFNTCADYTSLADAMLESLQQFGLTGVVQIRTAEVTLTRNAQGTANPLEVSVIEHMASMDRIFQYKSRMAYTYENVSLMVSNAPVEDQDRCGRLRDHLAMLVESAQVRFNNIVNSTELERRKTITQAIDHVTEMLNEIDKTQRECRMSLYLATSSMKESTEKEVWKLGLTESQDEELAAIISKNIENILNIQTSEVSIQNKLTSIITTLKGL